MEKYTFRPMDTSCHAELVSASQNLEIPSYADRVTSFAQGSTVPFVNRVRNDNKRAFTLAEVLITLTIIGVIAALTIPNLLQKHQEQEMVARLKKSYSIVSNAFAQAMRENGPLDEWDISPQDSIVGAEKVFNYIKPYLKVKKYCREKAGCFAPNLKSMTGGAPWLNIDSENRTLAKAILDDGTSLEFWSATNKCNAGTTTRCAVLGMDINGKKWPNKQGIDYFEFYFFDTKIEPKKIKQFCIHRNNDSRNGLGCTWWVISKGNMDYLRRDISTEW